MIHLVLLAACLLCACLPAWSQTPGKGQVELETVVVTATRQAQALSEILAPVIVIDRDTIERSAATDLADLLRLHAGVDIARNGGPGQPTSVFLRGSESNHTLVLIDGTRINPGTAGGAAFQHLSTGMIERVEVVKGPRSSLYGSEAIGGVIQIITRDARRGTTLGSSLGAGSFDTREASVEGQWSGRNTGLGASVNWMDTGGYASRTLSDARQGHDRLNINAHGEVQAGSSLLRARHWQSSGTTEYLDFLLTPLDQDFRNSVTSLQWQTDLPASVQSTLLLSNAVDRVDQNQGPDHFETDRNSLDWQGDWRSGMHHFTGGLYLSREDTAALSFGSAYDARTSVNALYLEDALRSGRHALVAAARYTDHETAGSHATWNLDYGIEATGQLQFTLGAGTGFRAPDSSERFGFGGNPALQPESSLNVELGAVYSPGYSQQAWLRVFRNDIDNLIEYVVTDFNTFEGSNQNVARARIQGVEAGFEIRQDSWRLRAEAVAQQPEDRDTGQALLRRARQSFTLSAVRALGALQAGIDILATGERKDFGFPEPVELPGYMLLDLSASYALSDRWSIRGKLANALDRSYQTADTYAMAGRSVYVSVHYQAF